MELVIIGAGAIGSAIARELVERDDVSGVRVVDTHVRALQELGESVPSPRLQSFQVDARDRNAMLPVLDNAAVVVGAGSPHLGVTMAAMALEHGCHYCDLGGPDSVFRAELSLADDARSAGRWIVPGCGLAPGLVNILCMHGIEQLDEVAAAYIRVGDVPLEPIEPFQFQLGASPQKVLEDYTHPVHVIESGNVTTVEPLTGTETIDFGPPFERLEAFHTSGSLSRLADRLAGRIRTLDHKSVQWPGHADRMRFLLELGLGDERSIDVRTHLTYRDILIRRMRQHLAANGPDVVLMRIAVQGWSGGRECTLLYELRHDADPDNGTSAIKRCTAVPAAAVAHILASGAVEGGGAAPPELVVPRDRFLTAVRDRGIDVQERRLDGHVPVDAPAVA